MSDALKAATEDLRLLCDLYENGSPITMSAAQFVAESGRTILAALREREQAIVDEREACAKVCDDAAMEMRGLNSEMARAHHYDAAVIRARGKEARA